MELIASEQKKKKMMRLRKWGFAFIFISFFVAAFIATGLTSARCNPLFTIVAFFVSGGSCFVIAYIFMNRAQKAKTQKIYIGENLLYIIHAYLKSYSTGIDTVSEIKRYSVTVVSPECRIKITRSKIKFYGGDLNLIKSKETEKKSNYNQYMKRIIGNGFADTLESAKGEYLARATLLRILQDDEEQKLIDLFCDTRTK